MAVSVPGGSVGANGTSRSTPGLAVDLLDLLDRAHPPWHQRAACRTSKLDFFDERPAAVAAAQVVCRGCPVAVQCGHYGADERYGVWGATSPAERGKGRRRAG